MRFLLLILFSSQAFAGRLFTSGFEANHIGTNSTEGWVVSVGAPAISTVQKKTGTYAFRSNPSGTGKTMKAVITTMVSGRTYYAGAYLYIASLPTATCQIFSIWNNSTTDAAVLFMTTGGALQLFSSTGSQLGSDSGTLSTATWYYIELSYVFTSGAATARLNGTEFANGTSGTSIAIAAVEPGIPESGVTADLYFDDVIVNDEQGANENSFPNKQRVVWLKPTADGARGSWTAGGGATTNLFEGINNSAPTGSSTDANANSIKTISSSATDTARFSLTTYTAAGVGASDTVKFVLPIVRTGEHSATSTKTGLYGIESNPTIATTNFNFGNNAGAHSNEIGGWRTTLGTATYSPSVTLGTAPVAYIVKTSTLTTGCEADFMGMMASYSEFVAGGGGVAYRQRRML